MYVINKLAISGMDCDVSLCVHKIDRTDFSPTSIVGTCLEGIGYSTALLPQCESEVKVG